MDRDEFANMVAFADLGPRRVARVLKVLRTESDRYEGINVRRVADGRFAVDDDVRVESDTRAERDIFAKCTKRTDGASVTDRGAARDDRCGMDLRCHLRTTHR